ncbi:hypothetical protein I4U23_030089 [Adineta vaga]|nr:hypothetical protein I4U23_030089 [Adineta vaga]
MSLNIIRIQLLLILGTIIFTDSFLLSKKKKKDHHLITAKHDPQMPFRVRELLEEIGDNPVIKIQLGRTPVEAVLIFFLNVFSLGKFHSKQMKLGYDEIYHNYLLITIQNKNNLSVLQNLFQSEKDAIGTTVYKLEKAHRVRLIKPTFPTEFIDLFDIPLTSNKILTLNRLITTASNIDKKFYTYDAGNNNMCQTFVENIVDINGLTQNIVDEKTRHALKPQDAKTLVATLGSRKDIVKLITDLGGNLDKLIFDRKVKWKEPEVKEFAVLNNVHVKIIVDIGQNKTNEVPIQSNNGIVKIDGMTDTIIENADDVYEAAVALEEGEKKAKHNDITFVIVGIIVAVLGVGTIALLSYIIILDTLTKNELVSNSADQ